MFSYITFFLSNFRASAYSFARPFVRCFSVFLSPFSLAVIVVVCSLCIHSLQFFVFFSFRLLHFSICFFLVAFILCVYVHKINGLKTIFPFSLLCRLLYLLSVLFTSMCKPLYHIANAFVHSKQYY